MEEQLTKKERKALKRQEKAEGREREQKTKKTKKALIWVLVVFVSGAALWFGITALIPEEAGQDFSQSVPSEGASHVTEGTRVEYQSNPPTSGNHWPVPLRDGIYDIEKPDEASVHSLEHGRIWVSYKPDIGEQAIQQLKDAVRGEAAVILTPRAANDSDIALAAWTRLDTFDLDEDGSFFDEKRVKDFIQRYRHKGPEYVPQVTGETYE